MHKSENSEVNKQFIINRIAIVLKEERKTNRWLASETGFSETSVSKWVTNNKQPNILIFYLIALILRRDIRDLFLSRGDIAEETRKEEIRILLAVAQKSKRTSRDRK